MKVAKNVFFLDIFDCEPKILLRKYNISNLNIRNHMKTTTKRKNARKEK